jgi:hypothetical protein
MLSIEYLPAALERIGQANMCARTMRMRFRIEKWLPKEDPELASALRQQCGSRWFSGFT